jgi:hypothetical protein
MTRLMTRIRPLTSPIQRAFRLDLRSPRGTSNRHAVGVTVMVPGADERLITRTELDRLRRTLPGLVA